MQSQVAILTGGGDRPYALGLALSLAEQGVSLDFIGSDFLESVELRASPRVRVLNLRGDVSPDAPALRKAARVLKYYARLLGYALTADPRVFHILWNNKFETLDRTLLPLYFRLCGRRLVMTVHNVNVRKRDGRDSVLNRFTLKFQYRSCDHLFVHTEQMKRQLEEEFGIARDRISVIPFGINSTVPDTDLACGEARARLGLEPHEKVLLFFGNIAPYKGLEFLVEAFAQLKGRLADARLVIAGRPKGAASYWAGIVARIEALKLGDRIVRRIEYVPDEDTEIYFKAADALVLPYTHVFQSGVLFLAYNFGLPVIAADVASMKEDVVEGETGLICRPGDAGDLADKIDQFYASALYTELATRRPRIRELARERHSWSRVAEVTQGVYDGISANAPQSLAPRRKLT